MINFGLDNNKNAMLASCDKYYFPMIPLNFGMEKYYYKPIYMTDIRLSVLRFRYIRTFKISRLKLKFIEL